MVAFNRNSRVGAPLPGITLPDVTPSPSFFQHLPGTADSSLKRMGCKKCRQGYQENVGNINWKHAGEDSHRDAGQVAWVTMMPCPWTRREAWKPKSASLLISPFLQSLQTVTEIVEVITSFHQSVCSTGTTIFDTALFIPPTPPTFLSHQKDQKVGVRKWKPMDERTKV